MGNSFNNAILNFTKKEQNEILSVLSDWGKTISGVRIVRNIKLENFLDPKSMKEILQVFLNHSKKNQINFDALAFDYKKACHNHCLKGKEIIFSNGNGKPSDLGRAITLDRFECYLQDNYDLKESQINSLIKALSEDSLSLDEIQKEYFSGEFGTWATWSDDKKNQGNPFHYLSPPHENFLVCANLGLSHIQTSRVHILLIYSYDSTIILRYPTIADADLYDYFSPAGFQALHGYTLPRNLGEIKAYIQKLKTSQKQQINIAKIKPRPEGIHDPFQLKLVTRAITL